MNLHLPFARSRIAAAMLAASVMPAMAAEVPPTGDAAARSPASPAGTSSRYIEEIIVTAQKREENLQDVPVSINAFSADMLDARGVGDPKDLPLVTPGLTIGDQAGYSVTYLRGIGSDAFLLADPSVALYIDGIYYPFSHGQSQNFGAIERIEVLKGPQGTLFGRNAVGGAINVITKNPDFTAPEVALQTSYGRFDSLQNRAHINVPLTDRLAMSVSAFYNRADSYRDGTVGGEALPLEVTRGARFKLRWQPIDALDLTLSAFELRQTGTGSLFATNSAPTALGSLLLIQPQTGYGGAVDAPAYLDLANSVAYGQATLAAGPLDIKLLGSRQSIKDGSLLDFDGSPMPLVFFNADNFGEIKTAELQLISNADSWAAERLQWIAGYYYYEGHQGIAPTRFGVAGSLLSQFNALLAPVIGPLGLPEVLPGTGLIAATGILDTDSNSAYAQATYDFTDWLALTLGARYQEEKRTLVESSGAVISPLGTLPAYQSYGTEGFLQSPGGNADTTKSLSPKVSLDVRPWDDGLVYLSYQKATKSSTYNAINFLPLDTPELVRPEKLTAYEVGIKTAVPGVGRFNAAAFQYELRDLQAQFISLLAGGAVTFENAPRARVRGVDFEFTGAILPSHIDGLVLGVSGAYLDAKYTDYSDGQGFNAAGVYTTGNDYTGNRIVRSPKLSGTVSLGQTFGLPSGDLEIAADYYYNSGFYYLAQNTAADEEKAYGLLGARIGYLHRPWNLRVTVFGSNVLDEKYNYSRFVTDFGSLDALAPPAAYGIRLNWTY